jgi:hypothetical protein
MSWVDEHPEAVEAAAKAAYCRCSPEPDAELSWAEMGDDDRALWRGIARAALAAVLAALSAGPEPEPLPEWQCPSCGATTRARMADQEPEYQWGIRAVGETEPHSKPTPGFLAELLAHGTDGLDAHDELVRRTVGEWVPVAAVEGGTHD